MEAHPPGSRGRDIKSAENEFEMLDCKVLLSELNRVEWADVVDFVFYVRWSAWNKLEHL